MDNLETLATLSTRKLTRMQSIMDNLETHATLSTRKRTRMKTNKTKSATQKIKKIYRV